MLKLYWRLTTNVWDVSPLSNHINVWACVVVKHPGLCYQAFMSYVYMRKMLWQRLFEFPKIVATPKSLDLSFWSCHASDIFTGAKFASFVSLSHRRAARYHVCVMQSATECGFESSLNLRWHFYWVDLDYANVTKMFLNSIQLIKKVSIAHQ